MKIQVLGSGCSTCKTLYNNVQVVVKNLGLKTEVEYSTDIAEIVELGAMSSPVFAIDGKIITAGKVPSNEEIKQAVLGGSSSSNKKSSGGCSCGGNC